MQNVLKKIKTDTIYPPFIEMMYDHNRFLCALVYIDQQNDFQDEAIYLGISKNYPLWSFYVKNAGMPTIRTYDIYGQVMPPIVSLELHRITPSEFLETEKYFDLDDLENENISDIDPSSFLATKFIGWSRIDMHPMYKVIRNDWPKPNTVDTRLCNINEFLKYQSLKPRKIIYYSKVNNTNNFIISRSADINTTGVIVDRNSLKIMYNEIRKNFNTKYLNWQL